MPTASEEYINEQVRALAPADPIEKLRERNHLHFHLGGTDAVGEYHAPRRDMNCRFCTGERPVTQQS